MNMHSVKIVALGTIGVLATTTSTLAQFNTNPIHLTQATSFTCGPHLKTYVVRSLDNRAGTGIRCVKFSEGGAGGASIPRLAWYGEGAWGGCTYRHLGHAFYEGRMLVGSASDFHGNGECTNNNFPRNLTVRGTTPDWTVIQVTGAWNEEWRSVSSTSYRPLPRPQTCGGYFDQYRVSDLGGGRPGAGLRCMLKVGQANTTWFGNGNWNGNTYSHLGTRGNNGYGAGDICGNGFGPSCNNFGYGSLTFTPTSGGFKVTGAWSEQWRR